MQASGSYHHQDCQWKPLAVFPIAFKFVLEKLIAISSFPTLLLPTLQVDPEVYLLVKYFVVLLITIPNYCN